MKLLIEKIGRHGEAPVTKYFLDGEQVDVSDIQIVSRAATRTDIETGRGIFSCGQIQFLRGKARVEIDFPDIDWGRLPAAEAMAEITRRAKAVKEAFASQYPAIHEVCEQEFS